MKPIAIISLLAVVLMGSSGIVAAQQYKTCKFNPVGTWKAQVSPTEEIHYTFDDKGEIKVTKVSGSAKATDVANAKYVVEDGEDGQKLISLTATGKDRIFGQAEATINVVSFDDSSMTCTLPGATSSVRWTKVDPNRYFIVLVARGGEFYDKSGSAFPIVIKLADGKSKIEGAGIYSKEGKAVFGAIPTNVYQEYLREARGDSETILRLEINGGQYERASKIVQQWQRRARENALPYTIDSAHTPPDPLNNILLVKAVVDTLNLCQNDFDLYKLDYEYPADWIANTYSPEWVPFMLFKELRKRNEARHIEYKKFQELVPLANFASR